MPLASVFNIEEGIWKSVVEPVLEIENSVEVEKVLPLSVVEPIANNVVAVELALAWIANLANGDEVATPMVPAVASANTV